MKFQVALVILYLLAAVALAEDCKPEGRVVLKALGPITSGPNAALDSLKPSDALAAFDRHYDTRRLQRQTVTCWKVGEYRDVSKHVPLIGKAFLCHEIYRCEFRFTDDQGEHLSMFYLDHNHFHSMDVEIGSGASGGWHIPLRR